MLSMASTNGTASKEVRERCSIFASQKVGLVGHRDWMSMRRTPALVDALISTVLGTSSGRRQLGHALHGLVKPIQHIADLELGHREGVVRQLSWLWGFLEDAVDRGLRFAALGEHHDDRFVTGERHGCPHLAIRCQWVWHWLLRKLLDRRDQFGAVVLLLRDLDLDSRLFQRVSHQVEVGLAGDGRLVGLGVGEAGNRDHSRVRGPRSGLSPARCTHRLAHGVAHFLLGVALRRHRAEHNGHGAEQLVHCNPATGRARS